MEKTIDQYRQEFLQIYDNITREGADKLLSYLQNDSDFFTAPASGRRHCAFEGGLVVHSVNAYNRFKKVLQAEYGEKYTDVLSEESIAIIALLHDICKVNTYLTDYRNQKVDGQWIQVPYYAYNNSLPYGHGEKSVYIVSGFMRLTREEAMCINWHMGGFDPRTKDSSDMSDAYKLFPNALLFHIADIEATYLDEK